MNIYNLIDNIVDTYVSEMEDGNTLINVIKHIAGGTLPETLTDGTLISSLVANEIDISIRTICEQENIMVDDDMFMSLIDGELYKYFTSRYVGLFYIKNIKTIEIYTKHWGDMDFLNMEAVH